MSQFKRPFEDHAFSRYMIVSEGVIDQLQADYFAGRELGGFLPDIDCTKATVILAESLEADHLKVQTLSYEKRSAVNVMCTL